MPREITFMIGSKEYKAVPTRVDRRKLYGWTELFAEDDNGNPCELLTVDEAGKNFIPLGGTGNGILDAGGNWMERSQLKTVDAKGDPAPLYRSSFGIVNKLSEKVTAQQYLDYDISDFYELTEATEELIRAVGDDIYTFRYTYNDSYNTSPAFVMAQDSARLFLLIGVKSVYELICFKDCEAVEDHDDNLIEDADGDLDFSML